MIRGAGVDHFGDTGNPVDQDSLETSFERHSRGRARNAGSDEFHRYETGLFVHIMQKDVAVIGLDCRANDLDDFFDLFTHAASLWNRGLFATLEPASAPHRERLAR